MPRIADRPFKLGGSRRYAQNIFPAPAPYAWLDRPGAPADIAMRLAASQLRQQEAAHCALGERDGYVILPGLLSAENLDPVWGARQTAVDHGRICLEPNRQAPATLIPAAI